MNDRGDGTRRALLAGLGGAALLLGGCAASDDKGAGAEAAAAPPEAAGEKDVTANEDLMREHGVLRRALLVYQASAGRLRRAASAVPPAALHRTALLFRSFGEDYHERRLEEPYIFPLVRRGTGPVAALPDILLAQHQRGREITDYVLRVSARGTIDEGRAAPLAQALESMILMYRHHMAREDTLVFPAWKDALSAAQYDELGDRFEDIERQQFGHDGFEDAVKQIGAIEAELGLADIAQFTAPPPPRA